MDNKTENKDSSESHRVRIGLALSGGGFRASFYHLGTIRYLEEVGIMSRMEVMSTVSGGSIIGAYYLVQMEKKRRANPKRDRLEVCDEIINEFTAEVDRNFRMQALVFYPFYHPIEFLLRLILKRHGGDTMAQSFQRRLYRPALRIGDLPVQVIDENKNITGTKLLLNTTSLISGQRVVFSRESDTGIKAQITKSDPNNIPLARAVSASAAVPGLFKPLRIGNEVLSDGGVVDNQGIESLFDYFQLTEPEFNRLRDTFRQPPELRRHVPKQSSDKSYGEGTRERPVGKVFLIVSDGAGQFAEKAVVNATRSQSATMAMSILQAANRRKVLKLLLASTEGDENLGGFAFTHLALNIKGPPGRKIERLPSEFIGPTAELRTDLDDFSRLERDALIYHGYTLMKYRIEEHSPDLIEESTVHHSVSAAEPPNNTASFSWPPPFVALCQANGRARRANMARDKIQSFLAVGKSAAFRDVRRFKWVYGPILTLFLCLGVVISKFALTGHIFFTNRAVEGGSTIHSFLTGYFQKAVSGVLPDYALIQQAFAEGGQLWGTVQVAAGLFCIAVSFYVVLWWYWEFKRLTGLPQKLEANMLRKLESIPADSDVDAGGKGDSPVEANFRT